MNSFTRKSNGERVEVSDVVRDRQNRRYYVSHLNSKTISCVSMCERHIHITEKPEFFNCNKVCTHTSGGK